MNIEEPLPISGRLLGPYRIDRLLGAGGMGEVYRARDTRLGRDVAIKLLAPAFTADPDRLARFAREARVLAALNHPNIAAIYGLVEEAASSEGSGTMVPALVLELVDGDTLAERLANGPLPIRDALAIARQLAEALEAAHEKGIIHRDLKPANIKVTPTGSVKVLDFGLAKAFAPDGPASDVSQAPTVTVGGTQTGVITGTPAYMSPEQARGQGVDRRADIWAFGCVLYEMLTGERAFRGDNVTDTVAAVVRAEPDWSALPAETPAALRRLLRRCLQKDLKERLQAIGDARIEITELLTGTTESPATIGASGANAPGRQSPVWRRALPWAVSVLLAVGLSALSLVHFRETPPAALPELRTEIVTPATDDAVSLALSPDGRQLAFVASGDGSPRLWVRTLSATMAQPLPGTEGAGDPFWSPDRRSIGFFADGKLKTLDLGGGAPRELANASFSRGGTWNAAGVILFAPTIAGPLFRVSASGGDAVAITKLDEETTSHRWPQFLPDGRRFLFYVVGAPERTGIYLGSLDTDDAVRLTTADTAGAFMAPDWLFWIRAGTLMAQRFDVRERALVGAPVTVADAVRINSAANAGAFSVSAAGLVAYRAGKALQGQLQWFDRAGKMSGTLGEPEDAMLLSPRVSPDDRRVAVSRTTQGNSDIWVLDGTRASRVTFDAGRDLMPQWSPDGSRIVFDSNRRGRRNLYVGAVGSPGRETLLLESSLDNVASNWSTDGRFLVYAGADPKTNLDVWVLPLTGDRTPFAVLKTNFQERSGYFSPDGRWIAYQSDESGRQEVYVRSFVPPRASPGVDPASGNAGSGQRQVSTAGGIYPVWSPDGREVYYLGPSGQMMAVPIVVKGPTLEPGTPAALFQTQIAGGGTENGQGRQYDVARDGRFLINNLLEDAEIPITLLQNWHPERED